MQYLTKKQIELLQTMLDSLAVMDIPADFIAYVNEYIDRHDMHLNWTETDNLVTAPFYDCTVEIEKVEGGFIPRIKLGEGAIFDGTQVLTLDVAERMIADHAGDAE